MQDSNSEPTFVTICIYQVMKQFTTLCPTRDL